MGVAHSAFTAQIVHPITTGLDLHNQIVSVCHVVRTGSSCLACAIQNCIYGRVYTVVRPAVQIIGF